MISRMEVESSKVSHSEVVCRLPRKLGALQAYRAGSSEFGMVPPLLEPLMKGEAGLTGQAVYCARSSKGGGEGELGGCTPGGIARHPPGGTARAESLTIRQHMVLLNPLEPLPLSRMGFFKWVWQK